MGEEQPCLALVMPDAVEPATAPTGANTQQDGALNEVEAELRAKPEFGNTVAEAIRDCFDTVIDGVRTFRWSIEQLGKTEKTHIGTQVEIELKKRLDLEDGDVLDTKIAGHEVDIKFTIGDTWMIPNEAINRICLVATANDERSECSIGLLRATEDTLRPCENRDEKRGVSAEGKRKIRWLIRKGGIKENFLLHLAPAIRESIMLQPGPGKPEPRKGQVRVNTLLRTVKNKLIPRYVICVLGQQYDPMKRVRDARKMLKKEGVTVLCGKYLKQRKEALEYGFKLGDCDVVSVDSKQE